MLHTPDHEPPTTEELIDRLNAIDACLERIERQLAEMARAQTQTRASCEKMDSHIDFVESFMAPTRWCLRLTQRWPRTLFLR